jgi:hypothetical protein
MSRGFSASASHHTDLPEPAQDGWRGVKCRLGHLFAVLRRQRGVGEVADLITCAYGAVRPGAFSRKEYEDAVPVGGELTNRFVADQAGSYWYHSHQVSNPQVAGGLLAAVQGDGGGDRISGHRCARACATGHGAGPAGVRLARPARLRSGPPDTPVRVSDQTPARVRERPARPMN